ncbi:hypothetical protein ACP70R_036426 [Stipagrostis hirtigluma subsp. patula]
MQLFTLECVDGRLRATNFLVDLGLPYSPYHCGVKHCGCPKSFLDLKIPAAPLKLHSTMALDLNVPATAGEDDDDPLGHFPGAQDLEPPAGAHPMEEHLLLTSTGQHMIQEVDWFNAHAEAANFELNIDSEQQEADEDAAVYCGDFHVIFEEDELQGSRDEAHGEQGDAFNAPSEAATFDLNYDLEEDNLQGASDEDHVQQGSQAEHATTSYVMLDSDVEPPVIQNKGSHVAEAVRQALKVKQGMLFPKRSLYPGAVLPAGTKFSQSNTSAPSWRFISKAEANTVPFGYQHQEKILAIYGIPQGSKKAKQVSETLNTCLTGGGHNDEPHTCTTSWQAMVEFAAETLGTSKPWAATTITYGKKEPLRYVVAPNGITEIGNDRGQVPCHPMPCPYEVFFCHHPKETQALKVELVGQEDGALGTTAIAECHMNTSDWDDGYFKMLGAQRGEPICHFMPQGYVLWLGSAM